MNTNTARRFLAGILGIGAAAVLLAGTIAPAFAQGRGPLPRRLPRDQDDNGRYDNGRYENGRRNDDRYDDRYNDRDDLRNNGTVNWNDIDRRPNVSTRSRAGFYVWREGDYIHVVANDQNRGRASRYSGTVTVDNGSFSDLDGISLGDGDRREQTRNNRIAFSFVTGDGIDGMKFRVNGGRRITLRLNESGRNREPIFIGRDQRRITADPLVIRK